MNSSHEVGAICQIVASSVESTTCLGIAQASRRAWSVTPMIDMRELSRYLTTYYVTSPYYPTYV